MGQSQSISEYSENNLKEFSKNYTKIKGFYDPRYGEIEVFENKTYIKNFVYSTKKNFAKYEDSQMYLDEIKKREKLKHRNIGALLGYIQSKNENACGSSYTITLYGEYSQHDLQAELEKRAPSQDFLSEPEIWYLIDALISANSFFEQWGIYHGDLRPCNVLLTEEGFAKIIDHGIIHPLRSGYLKTISGKEKCYLAPELIDSYTKSNFNVYKADVYSLGMTLLYVVSLQNPLNSCYNYPKGVINHDKVESLLKAALQRYSGLLVDLIRRMLLINPVHRMSFKQIEATLAPYASNIRAMKDFSVPNVTFPSPMKTISPSPIKNISASPINIMRAPQPIQPIYQMPMIYQGVENVYDADELDRKVEEALKISRETIERNKALGFEKGNNE